MIRNILLNTGSSVIYFFTQWLTTVLAVRLGNFEIAGNYALIISFTTLFYCIAQFGIRNYQISDAENKFSDGQYFAARLISSLVSFLLFAILVRRFAQTKYSVICYGFYMFFKLGEVFTDGYFSVLQIYSNYAQLAVSYTIKGVVSCVAFSTSLAITHDLLPAVVWMSISYWICVILFDIPYLLGMELGKPVFNGCVKILINCAPLMIVSQSTAIMNYITRGAINRELNSYLLGQYSSLSSILTIMSTFAVTIFVVIIPRVAELKQKSQWRKVLHLCGQVLMGIILSGAITIVIEKLWGKQICKAIFGESILENFNLLIPLTITAIVLACKLFFSSILVPLDRRWDLLIGESCGVLTCALFTAPLTRQFGMQGTNLSYLIGTAVQLLIMISCTIYIILKNEGSVANGRK